MKLARILQILSLVALLALLAASGSLLFPAPARAAGIAVNSKEDIIEDTGECTLREAIIAANTDMPSGGEEGECIGGSGPDSILLETGIYTLTLGTDPGAGQLWIADDLTITGADATIIKSANNARIFAIDSAKVKLANLTVTDGHGVDGGAVYSNNGGTLTIENCAFIHNTANNNGGAIATGYGGSMTISASVFEDNAAGNGGGAIHSLGGTTTIDNSVFSGNSAGGYGTGGAIHNRSELFVTNSSITGNSANDGGGISNSANAELTVRSSTIAGNTASNDDFGMGGGIFNEGTLNIANSTLANNAAGGLWSIGGGIAHSGFGVLTITNSTISGNSATYGGGLRLDGALNYTNTIIANSPLGGDCLRLNGAVAVKANNLVEDGACFATWSGDPLLGDLADNGGPSETLALLPGSPAIDAGYDAACAESPVFNLDQRGLTRQKGAHCDLGAYESDGTAAAAPAVSAITPANPGPTSLPSETFTVTFTVSVTGVDVSDFALAASGITGASVSAVSEAVSALAAPAAGSSAYTVTVDTGSGIGTLRLDVLDDDTILDAALNPLGGPGTGNGSYTSAAAVYVRFLPTFVPLTVR